MLASDSHPFVIFMRDLPRRNFIRETLHFFTADGAVNANLLLYCIWYGLTEQGRLKRPDFKRLQATLHPWHERICLELQYLASTLTNDLVNRQWVEAEIKVADQLEQQMLAETLGATKKISRSLSQQLTDACMNVVSYFKGIHFHLDLQGRENLLAIFCVLFSDNSMAQIQESLDQALYAVRLDDSGFTQLTLV